MAKPGKQRIPFLLCGLLGSLSGCANDYSLAPPPDSEQVTVRLKVLPELKLKAETMEVMYRSAYCRRTRYDAYGKSYQVDGFHGIDVELQRQGQSDTYEARLAKDGGGACRWHLANVTFGVSYGEPERFGENVSFGAGGGVVVIFDHNDSPRGSANVEVDGDLTIKKGYYPWLSEMFLGGHRKRISLTGDGGIYLKYKAPQARHIYFEPVVHSRYVVSSVGPKAKVKGNYIIFTYPDGSFLKNNDIRPRFQKLESIRLAAENRNE